MAIPIIFGAIAAVTGAVGVGKGVKGAMDTKEANDVQERAEHILERAQASMEKTKNATNEAIQELGKTKLQVSAKELKTFVDIFSKIKDVELEKSQGLEELSKLNITEETLKEMKKTALGATDVIGSGIAGVGAGALLGWGTYGGIMALGTASTGAAIGGLSGAAATNATLAWLGGGAIAAGGGGMALGTMVLGGIIAGPALLVAGGIFGSKAKEKLNNAYSNLSEAKKIRSQLESGEAELKVIIQNAGQLNKVLSSLAVLLNNLNREMKKVTERSLNWREYSDSEKEKVAAAVSMAQLVKKVIDIPLLTEEGVLTQDVRAINKDEEVLELVGLEAL